METSKKPFVLHEAVTPYVLLWIALMIPNRLLAATTVLPLLALSYYKLLQTTSPSPPAGFIIGAYISYHAFLSINLLVLRDPRKEFRRTPCINDVQTKHSGEGKTGTGGVEGEPYPRDLKRRLWWTFDLMVTMRGIGWSWAIRNTPRLSPEEIRSRGLYLRRRLATLLGIYAWLDFSMFIMHHVDRAYFLPPGNLYEGSKNGPVYPTLLSLSVYPRQHPPPLGLPDIPLGLSGLPYRTALYIARHLLQGIIIYISLNGSYVFISLSTVLLGTLIGSSHGWRRRYLDHTSWPNLFGSWTAGDWGDGISGWWGRAWHSLFRNVFTAPSRHLNLPRGSPQAITIYLTTPFLLSAILHYAGAHTRSSDGWGSARFFLFQPLGIAIEQLFARMAPKTWEYRPLRYVWAILWFVVSSGSFFEELRYGGVWAMQPIPLSIWKWMAGLGAWCWSREERGWWEWDSSVGGWGVRL